MKKTISINLNGLLFNIDEDAYEKLHAYINKIEVHFAGQESSAEIMADIEGRIAELFYEKTRVSNRVITLADVDEVILTMGNPVDFQEAEPETSSSSTHQQTHTYTYRTKRIYRDPDNRVLGGVCGGLGHYFNIDPLIFRILFIVLFFGYGTGLLIYIIMWIIIPEARTTAQKLEMRGDPVNVSNIGNFFRDEFNHVKNSFTWKKEKIIEFEL
ncbi:MAG: PspC domain-containing protein [Bacteroidales bacterium]|nr:PspC domain-containing protein [Bacteroidales bacterium]